MEEKLDLEKNTPEGEPLQKSNNDTLRNPFLDDSDEEEIQGVLNLNSYQPEIRRIPDERESEEVKN